MRIGPEPTTDKFIVIMNGEDDSMIPGRILLDNTRIKCGFVRSIGETAHHNI